MSLVDPDNRRPMPMDFAHRRKLVSELPDLRVEAIMKRMEEGLPKMWLIRQGLHLRRNRPGAFGPDGSYRPMHATGRKDAHVVAFMCAEQIIAIAPRLVVGPGGDWGDTRIELPAGKWENVLTRASFKGGQQSLPGLLARFPVALLAREA